MRNGSYTHSKHRGDGISSTHLGFCEPEQATYSKDNKHLSTKELFMRAKTSLQVAQAQTDL